MSLTPSINMKAGQELENDVDPVAIPSDYRFTEDQEKNAADRALVNNMAIKPRPISENNFNKYDTSIDQKKLHFPGFVELVKNQFWHGGDKYSLSENKEFTDAICECFPGASGIDWVLGTCMKYLGRYKNFGREKDLLKVATYMYILWLKGGFYLSEEHDEDVKR